MMELLDQFDALLARLGLAWLADRFGLITVAAAAALVAVLVLAFILAFLGARIGRARDRRRRDPDMVGLRRRGLHDYIEEGRNRQPARAGPGRSLPREGPGFMPRFRWFVVGIVVGVAGTVFWTSESPTIAAIRAHVFAILESPQAIEGETEPTADPAAEADRAAAAERRKIAALVDAYVIETRKQLPVMVAPAIALARVEPRDQAVALGFDLTQRLTPEEERVFRSELQSRFRDGACAIEPGPLTIPGLNQAGVAFEVSYTDPAGRIFAEWRAEPGFCAR